MSSSQRSSLRLTLAASCLALAGLASLSLAGWPGEKNGCFEEARPTCFCEEPQRGWVAQPSNTFSNFGFLFVGCLIAAASDRRLGEFRRRHNLMTQSSFYPSFFGVVIALLGPGSMALHASMTGWGGQIDVASMYFFGGLSISYGVVRLRNLSQKSFTLLYAGLVGPLVLIKLLNLIPVEPLFGALLIASLLIELWLWRKPGVTIRKTWGFLSIGLFLTAFGVWLPSLSGGPWCDPQSWLQGHAVWHLLCAAAAGSLFLYYLSEDTSGAPEH